MDFRYRTKRQVGRTGYEHRHEKQIKICDLASEIGCRRHELELIVLAYCMSLHSHS